MTRLDLNFSTAIFVTMNQVEIRFFVSTMNAVEDAIPELDVKNVIDNLNNLLEKDDKVTKESREVIKQAIDDLEVQVKDFDDKLFDLDGELSLLSPVQASFQLRFDECQSWRYEPYPWLGAPASPLLPLFNF
jgi:malate synthase